MRAVSLFSGIGGSSLGMVMAGYETTGYELNQWAVDRANEAGTATVLADLNNGVDFEADHVHSSAPCQAFSRCGHKADWHEDVANLTVRAAEIIMQTSPATLSWENVTESVKSPQFKKAVKLLSRRYDLLSFNADASRCGCAQIRHRLWMIGVRRGRGTREALLALVPQIKERMQNGSRTVLRDVIPELEDRQVFLYPRHTRDPCLFPSSGCTPTIRRMALAKPTPGIGPTEWSRGISDADTVVFTPELLARVSGFPDNHFTIRLRQQTRWALGFGNCVPPPMQHYIMTLVAQVRELAGTGRGGSYTHGDFALRRGRA